MVLPVNNSMVELDGLSAASTGQGRKREDRCNTINK
jgi:hypothetical protein